MTKAIRPMPRRQPFMINLGGTWLYYSNYSLVAIRSPTFTGRVRPRNDKDERNFVDLGCHTFTVYEYLPMVAGTIGCTDKLELELAII